MERTLRMCINCKKIHGCVVNHKAFDCRKCEHELWCNYRNLELYSKPPEITGSVCEECFKNRKNLIR